MAGLPWIRVDNDLPSSPKVIHLGELVGGQAQALAHLLSLWCWAARVAPSGVIRGPTAVLAIETGAGWTGSRGQLADALVTSGWLDADKDGFVIHDWIDYQLAHVEKEAERRASDRIRKRRSRGQSAEIRPLRNETRRNDTDQKQLPSRTASPAGPETKLAKAPVSKAKHPRHQPTIALFVKLWAELRGGKYEPFGSRDGAAVKRILAMPEATDEEIERRMRLAFADPWFRQHGHLALFVSRWSNYDGSSSMHENGARKQAIQAPSPHSAFSQGGQIGF